VLNLRAIALQGFGFKLSPISLAVQGLIAWLEEEQRQQQVYGSGKGRGPYQARKEFQAPALRQQLSTEEVRAAWDFVELRLRQQQDDKRRAAAARRPIVTPSTPAPAASAAQAAALARTDPPASAGLPLPAERMAERQEYRAQAGEDDASILAIILAAA